MPGGVEDGSFSLQGFATGRTSAEGPFGGGEPQKSPKILVIMIGYCIPTYGYLYIYIYMDIYEGYPQMRDI